MKIETKKNDTHFFALGGLDEIGKNTYIVEHEGEIIIIDAGMKLSDSAASGIDAIVPQYDYLVKNKDRVVGLFITHGHEDHIGGIPYLIQQMDIKKIWAPRIAKALIEKKLDDKGVVFKGELIEFGRDFVLESKKMRLEAFEVNHSIPDSFGCIVETSNGTRILHTGDWKFDMNPIGADFELDKVTAAAAKGVDLLVSDSTGALTPGWTSSESTVAKTLEKVITQARGRVMIAAFASNTYRIKQICELAHKYNRKIVSFGRSMVKVLDIARKIDLIQVPDSVFIDKKELGKFKDNEVLILMTGSQGEQLAALSRIADGEHQQVSINKDDTIVLSSSPIPGNRISVSVLLNKLYKKGATVLDNALISSLHTSGHSYKEEQRMLLKMVKPKHFLPQHGEYAMLKEHINTAIETGVDPKCCYQMTNGDVLTIPESKKDFKITRAAVPAATMYIDGKSQESTSEDVIRDRIDMGQEGIVAVYLTINSKKNILEQNPAVLSRGCFYADDNKDLIYKIKTSAKLAALDVFKAQKPTFSEIKKRVKSVVGNIIWKEFQKRPIIVPVIVNTHVVDSKKNVKPKAKVKTEAK